MYRTTALTYAVNEKTTEEAVTSEELHDLKNNFWKKEKLDQQEEKPKSHNDEAEQHFMENTTTDSERRYVIKIPFKSDYQQLGQSFEQPRRRFLALERRLASDQHKYNEYL